MHVPPVRSTRREGGRAKREGASTNPLQPKRDRGLPRPRVLEARPLLRRARPRESGAQTIGDKLWTSARAPQPSPRRRLARSAAATQTCSCDSCRMRGSARCKKRQWTAERPTLRPAPSASSAPAPPRRAARGAALWATIGFVCGADLLACRRLLDLHDRCRPRRARRDAAVARGADAGVGAHRNRQPADHLSRRSGQLHEPRARPPVEPDGGAPLPERRTGACVSTLATTARILRSSRDYEAR